MRGLTVKIAKPIIDMKRYISPLSILLVFITFFVVPAVVYATIGVGVGTGKIYLKEDLRPGMRYELPPVSVLNTGDEEGDYEVVVTYHQDQEQYEPAEEWFTFSPQKFHLKPEDVQSVEISMTLPIKTIPGDYFAYIEAHPFKKSKSGDTTIAIAAATKLYFTVAAANIFQGIYYRALSIWRQYQPWTNIVAVLVLIVVAVSVFRRIFNVQIRLTRKKKSGEKSLGKDQKRKND